MQGEREREEEEEKDKAEAGNCPDSVGGLIR